MISTSTASNPRDSRGHVVVRWLLAVLTAVTTFATVSAFYHVVSIGGLNIAEAFLVPLFAFMFGWIAFSFWTATVGLILQLWRGPANRPSESELAPGPLTPTAILKIKTEQRKGREEGRRKDKKTEEG